MGWFQFSCAIALALAQPIILVIVRHELRFSRLRALYEFDMLFEVSRPKARPNPNANAEPAQAVSAPTYEYVRARYTDDLEFPDNFPSAWVRNFDMGQPEFRAYVRSLRWWQVKSSRALILASLPLSCMIAFGLCALFSSVSGRLVGVDLVHFASPLLVSAGVQSPAAAAMLASNVTVVAEAAFLGGYVFILMLFLRALATFDLSPLSILRGTVYFAIGIVCAVVFYLAFPDIAAQVAAALPSSNAAAPAHTPGGEKPLSAVWIALAFLLGFTPDLAINGLISRVQKTFKIKAMDDRLMSANKSIPLELIDGIDVLTRFRLQEANIFEVQNLAVTNPVMLFVESPYGIYEVIDWVAQAQLCAAVGPERFLQLQRRGIRTIFDLERAVLSVYATSQLRRWVAGVLLATAPNNLDADILVSAYAGLNPAAGPGAAAQTAAQFDQWAANLFSVAATASDGVTAAPDPDETIKHLVRTMVDDLHVCRLRQVWQQIMSKIDGAPAGDFSCDRLWDTEWLPRLPSGVIAPPYYGRPDPAQVHTDAIGSNVTPLTPRAPGAA